MAAQVIFIGDLNLKLRKKIDIFIYYSSTEWKL